MASSELDRNDERERDTPGRQIPISRRQALLGLGMAGVFGASGTASAKPSEKGNFRTAVPWQKDRDARGHQLKDLGGLSTGVNPVLEDFEGTNLEIDGNGMLNVLPQGADSKLNADLLDGKEAQYFKDRLTALEDRADATESEFGAFITFVETNAATVNGIVGGLETTINDDINDTLETTINDISNTLETTINDDIVVTLETIINDDIAGILEDIVNVYIYDIDYVVNDLSTGTENIINDIIDGVNNVPGVDIDHVDFGDVDIPNIDIPSLDIPDLPTLPTLNLPDLSLQRLDEEFDE